MNHIKKKHIIIALLLAAALLGVIMAVIRFSTGSADAEETASASQNTAQSASPQETASAPGMSGAVRGSYEQLLQMIDEGDCTGFAAMLLTEAGAREAFDVLLAEDRELAELILTNAMLAFEGSGRIDQIVLLRQQDFLSDNCFLMYWEVMGTVLPEAQTDYLIHELKLAFDRDDYVVRSFRDMREAGIIDDAMHTALLDALGFDYTDETYMRENNIAPLQELTPEQRCAYETVQGYIDQGDFMSIVTELNAGAVPMAVYEQLMAEDAGLMELIISQGMSLLAEEGRYQELIRLRLEGFVSDPCFASYWQMTDGEIHEVADVDGIDGYLLRELEQIYYRNANGGELLREIWYSGLMSDPVHDALVDRLGFDYSA